MKQLHGPELGYNNLLDFSAALGLLLEFEDPAAVVIKHTNPCGAALGARWARRWRGPRRSDPVSIYGGIVGVNRTLDMAVVEELAGIFVEILFAPVVRPRRSGGAQADEEEVPRLRAPCDADALPARLAEYRSVLGGLLAQSTDLVDLDVAALKTVTKRAPTAEELTRCGLPGEWASTPSPTPSCCRPRPDRRCGRRPDEPPDSAQLAVVRAREAGLPTEGTVCASDAFFPFRDGFDVVAGAGARAVIQPGGSLRDDEVIAAADEQGIAMVLTGLRHFRH